MREIKFRAWDKLTKTMLNWGDDAPVVKDAIPWECGDEWTDRCEVMQYIGLKDKNGKEIYEGDIIKTCDGSISGSPWMRPNREIKYNEKGLHNCFSWEPDSTHWFEVIGNIHETPELLEVA